MAFNTTEVLVAGIVGALAVGVGQLGVFAYQTIFKKKLSPKIARLVPVALLAASIVPARTFVTPAVEEYQFQKKLTDDKMFAAYKQYYPAEFDAFVAVAKADHRNGTSIQEQHEKAYQAGQNMVYRHVSSASNEAITKFALASVGVTQELADKSPSTCSTALSGRTPGPSENKQSLANLSDATKATLEDAIVDVLRTSATAPQSPASQQDALAVMTPIIKSMYQKYGDQLRVLQGASPASLSMSDKSVCILVADLYGRIAALPLNQAGPALRSMMTK